MSSIVGNNISLTNVYKLSLVNNDDPYETKMTNLVIFIDISGSMYDIIKNVGKAAALIIKSSNIDVDHLYLYEYNTECKNIKYNSINEYVMHLENIRSSGGTNFIPTFTELNNLLSKLGNNETNIIYMTDGGHSSYSTNNELYGSEYTKMVENIKKNNCKIDTLGYTNSQNVELLNNLSNISVDGMYQNIENIQNINDNIEQIMKFSSNRKLVEIVINNEKKQLYLTKNNDLYEGVFYDDNVHDKIEVIDNENTISFDVNFIENSNLSDLAIYIDDFIKNNAFKNDSGFIKRTYESITGHVNNLYDEFKQIKNRLDRKTKLGKINEIRKNLNMFGDIYRKTLLGEIRNNDRISFYDTIYKSTVRNKFQNMIDKRAMKNAENLNNEELELQEYIKTLDVKDLEQKSENIDDSCMFTTEPINELISNGDCLCIGFNVTRNETCIADPSNIVVNEIYPVFLGADIFEELVKNMINKGNKEQLENYSSFGIESSAKIGESMPNARINAALPLYYFNEHWKVSKIYMKRIMGLITTLDPLGYTYRQTLTIPFKVYELAKMNYEQHNSEINKKIYDLVKDVCINIISDNEQYFINKANKYDYESVNEFISNNKIFAIQMKLSNELGITSFDKFEEIILEETRRRINKGNIRCSLITELINYDKTIYIDNKLTNYINLNKKDDVKDDHYTTIGKSLLGITETEEKEQNNENNENNEKLELLETKEPNDVAEFVLNENGENTLNKYLSTMNDVQRELNLGHIDMSFVNSTIENSVCFMLTTSFDNKHKKVLQNDCKYIGPCDQENTFKFCKNEFIKCINIDVSNIISEYINKYNSSSDLHGALYFVKSDPIGAFGAINGQYIGRNFYYYVVETQKNEATYIEDKLRMILGNYKGHGVYTDKKIWKLSPRNFRKFWLKYKDQVSEKFWDDIINEYGLQKLSAKLGAWQWIEKNGYEDYRENTYGPREKN